MSIVSVRVDANGFAPDYTLELSGFTNKTMPNNVRINGFLFTAQKPEVEPFSEQAIADELNEEKTERKLTIAGIEAHIRRLTNKQRKSATAHWLVAALDTLKRVPDAQYVCQLSETKEPRLKVDVEEPDERLFFDGELLCTAEIYNGRGYFDFDGDSFARLNAALNQPAPCDAEADTVTVRREVVETLLRVAGKAIEVPEDCEAIAEADAALAKEGEG